MMLSQYSAHAPKQVRDGLPAEAQALQLHLICEELESRDDLTMSSPAAVRCRHPLWLQCRRQSRWLATGRHCCRTHAEELCERGAWRDVEAWWASCPEGLPEPDVALFLHRLRS